MKKIILTGGGSAGHVTPNLALIPKLLENNYTIEYIGSHNGIEKELLSDAGITYHEIASGKLRRYFSWQNFIDPFKVVYGMVQAFFILGKSKPNIIFSKGGFVTVPVIFAAKLRSIPVIIHESDTSPGLANKLSIKAAKKVCTTFEETLKHFPAEKGVHTGSPIREEIFTGDPTKGYALTNFTKDKPILLVMGGSLGAKAINQVLRDSLPELLKTYQIIHLCGANNLDPALDKTPSYLQYEYVKSKLPDLFAITDMIISRSGSNALSEILALRLPNILIPLSASASRGDQILNASNFAKKGYSYVLVEEELSTKSLIEAIQWLDENQSTIKENMSKAKIGNGIEAIIALLEAYKK